MAQTIEAAQAWKAAHETALLVPVSDRAALEVRGGDRRKWLNGLVTCDVAKLADGEAMYGLATAQKGRILADLYITAGEGRLVLFAPTEVRESLREAFEHYLVMEDAETALVDEAAWFVHGPAAAKIVAAVRVTGGFAAKLDLLGHGGALVTAPAAARESMDAALTRIVTAAGGLRLSTDDPAWEAVRIAAAVPRWGRDFDATHYPQEASLEDRAVSFQKGCYLGQEVVCMLQLRGHVSRKLVPVELAADAKIDAPSTVQDPTGADVGKVTSVAPSPDGSSLRALALVKYALATPGQALAVAGQAGTVTSPLG